MMQTPMKLIGVATALLVVGAAGGLWLSGVLSPAQQDAALPVPPEPPRLSQAPEYGRCLDLLLVDPSGARGFARDWHMQGGGEGAAQCEALAQLSLGEADPAAEALERIAVRSEAGIAARAAVFGQAAEAWRAAGKPQRAAAAASLALALTPQDADLLLERAMARLALGQEAAALADLDLAVVLDADRAPPRNAGLSSCVQRKTASPPRCAWRRAMLRRFWNAAFCASCVVRLKPRGAIGKGCWNWPQIARPLIWRRRTLP
jgi:tetratricopeptide (TPR) repeat protein